MPGVTFRSTSSHEGLHPILWSGLPCFAMHEYSGESIAASAWTSLGVVTPWHNPGCAVTAGFPRRHVNLTVVSSTMENPWRHLADSLHCRSEGLSYELMERASPLGDSQCYGESTATPLGCTILTLRLLTRYGVSCVKVPFLSVFVPHWPEVYR